MSAAASSSKLKDEAMPTPRSLGFDLKYQKNIKSTNSGINGSSSPNPTKIVVVAGWMGAKERQLKPYLEFYNERGFDTLSFAVGPHHVLFPSRAMKTMEAVLKHIKEASGKDGGVQAVVFHHFSVGGFLFGQMLRLLEKEKETYAHTQSTFKAQVFDSPPDYSGIAKGVSRSMGINGTVEKAIEAVLTLFLKLTESTSGVEHKAASAAFHGNSIKVPSLWFYSKKDPVADWRDCEIVWQKWRARGTDVETVVWEETPHIQHARYDPERYYGTLDKFLKKHGII
jgi:Eukaryotic protein of unknown function (DUF829)